MSKIIGSVLFTLMLISSNSFGQDGYDRERKLQQVVLNLNDPTKVEENYNTLYNLAMNDINHNDVDKITELMMLAGHESFLKFERPFFPRVAFLIHENLGDEAVEKFFTDFIKTQQNNLLELVATQVLPLSFVRSPEILWEILQKVKGEAIGFIIREVLPNKISMIDKRNLRSLLLVHNEYIKDIIEKLILPEKVDMDPRVYDLAFKANQVNDNQSLVNRLIAEHKLYENPEYFELMMKYGNDQSSRHIYDKLMTDKRVLKKFPHLVNIFTRYGSIRDNVDLIRAKFGLKMALDWDESILNLINRRSEVINDMLINKAFWRVKLSHREHLLVKMLKINYGINSSLIFNKILNEEYAKDWKAAHQLFLNNTNSEFDQMIKSTPYFLKNPHMHEEMLEVAKHARKIRNDALEKEKKLEHENWIKVQAIVKNNPFLRENRVTSKRFINRDVDGNLIPLIELDLKPGRVLALKDGFKVTILNKVGNNEKYDLYKVSNNHSNVGGVYRELLLKVSNDPITYSLNDYVEKKILESLSVYGTTFRAEKEYSIQEWVGDLTASEYLDEIEKTVIDFNTYDEKLRMLVKFLSNNIYMDEYVLTEINYDELYWSEKNNKWIYLGKGQFTYSGFHDEELKEIKAKKRIKQYFAHSTNKKCFTEFNQFNQ